MRKTFASGHFIVEAVSFANVSAQSWRIRRGELCCSRPYEKAEAKYFLFNRIGIKLIQIVLYMAAAFLPTISPVFMSYCEKIQMDVVFLIVYIVAIHNLTSLHHSYVTPKNTA